MFSTNKPYQTIFFNYNLVKCFNCYKQDYIVKNCIKLKQTNIKKIKKKRHQLRKQICLGKDFFLNKFKINFLDINLYQLVSKLYLTIFYILILNKYIIILNTLANTRANGFVFFNTFCIINIAKFLNIKT